jgi:hypothetical protein
LLEVACGNVATVGDYVLEVASYLETSDKIHVSHPYYQGSVFYRMRD